ncbi:hypothetical protein BGZ52_013331, partial [Haplosporangium bisporale]
MRYTGVGSGTRNVLADVVVRVGDGTAGVLMSARSLFESKDILYILKNSKGTVGLSPIQFGGYTAEFDGYKW